MDSQVSCLMDANPASDLTFKWKFNTTSNTVDIPVTFSFLEDLSQNDLIQLCDYCRHSGELLFGKFNSKWSVMFNKNVNTVIVVFKGSS